MSTTTSTSTSTPTSYATSTGALQQISGLASGLDTAAIISALMGVAQQPQLRVKNQITVETARQQAYASVQQELTNLTTAFQSATDVASWAPQQTVGSSDSNTVSATLTGGAAAGAYEVSVTQLARANQFTSGGVSTATADDTIHITTGAGTTDVKITAGDNLSAIAQKITQTTGSPVYATVLNGNLVLSNKQSGTANAVTAVTTNGTSGLTFAESQTARDAQFSIDGKDYTSASNVATSALAGVTLTLSGLTSAPTTINVTQPTPDTAGIESKLSAFVTQYNSVISDLQSRLSEQPIPNANTDADRVKGVLYADQGLERLLSGLRSAVTDAFSGGTLKTLADAGLSTGIAVGSGSLNQDSIDGKLTLDTAKLESAMNTNFDAVKQLFTHATGSYSTEGLAQRLTNTIKPYTDSSLLGGYLGSAIQNETTTIKRLNASVADWDIRLALKQQTYETEFTQMETALSQSQSLGNALSSDISKL